MESAEKCLKMLNHSPLINETFCNAVFDGILCWNATRAGSVAEQPCPKNFQKLARKKCEGDGKWYFHEELNREWTDYSECVPDYDLYQTWLPIIKNVSFVGYYLSLIFLIISLFIFKTMKRLKSSKNKLHTQLFLSFIMRALMYLLKEYVMADGISVTANSVLVNGMLAYVKENANWLLCKLIIIAKNYSVMANYTFALMEGIYLHNLIFFNLYTNNTEILAYIILGWGLPLLFITPWIIIKSEFDNTLCWTTYNNNYYRLLITIPITITIVLNFFIFIRILRVLCGKINSMYTQQLNAKYKKLARSILILNHLLGIPYTISLVVYYTANRRTNLEIIWIFCDQSFTAFQGFIVAMLFCILNREVRLEIQQKYTSFQLNTRRRRSRQSNTIQKMDDHRYVEEDNPNQLNKSPQHWRMHF